MLHKPFHSRREMNGRKLKTLQNTPLEIVMRYVVIFAKVSKQKVNPNDRANSVDVSFRRHFTHCYSNRLNPKRINSFQFCLPALLGILRHFLDKFKQWHFHSSSNEVIWLKKNQITLPFWQFFRQGQDGRALLI